MIFTFFRPIIEMVLAILLLLADFLFREIFFLTFLVLIFYTNKKDILIRTSLIIVLIIFRRV